MDLSRLGLDLQEEELVCWNDLLSINLSSTLLPKFKKVPFLSVRLIMFLAKLAFMNCNIDLNLWNSLTVLVFAQNVTFLIHISVLNDKMYKQW